MLNWSEIELLEKWMMAREKLALLAVTHCKPEIRKKVEANAEAAKNRFYEECSKR